MNDIILEMAPRKPIEMEMHGIIVDAVSPRVSFEVVDEGLIVTIVDIDGTHTALLPKGKGETGVGISNIIFNDDYTLTIELSDGRLYNTGNIRGLPGKDGTDGVQDVQVNGVSVLDAQGVAEIPYGTANRLGVLQVGDGFSASAGVINVDQATADNIKAGASQKKTISPYQQHRSAFYGLAKAAGDTTQSASSNAVGTYTESAKSKISEMLNGSVSVTGTTPTITALSGIQYVCGEVSTLDIALPASGIVDVVFTSGSTPTVLTITPPTGVTLKWANGFDPTALEANTTYEINIADGLGVAGVWS